MLDSREWLQSMGSIGDKFLESISDYIRNMETELVVVLFKFNNFRLLQYLLSEENIRWPCNSVIYVFFFFYSAEFFEE